MLSSTVGAGEALTEAVGLDPDFALANAALSRVRQATGPRSEAMRLADRAVELTAPATQREREHAAIQQLLANGRGAEALRRIRDHLLSHPLDALMLAPAASVLGLIGLSGRTDREAEQLALVAPLADAYGDDWWFLAVHAFALIETGRWSEGRELAERSIELKPDSAQAAHVLSHAHYEGGDNEAALAFLDHWLPNLDPRAALHCHLWWHYCLVLLAEGDLTGATDAYDQHCAPAVSISPPLNVVTDGASFLWRAQLCGMAADPARWQAVDAEYRDRFEGPTPFVDAHAALAMVMTGDDGSLDEHLAAVARLDAEGKVPAASVTFALTEAFRAFAEQRWDDVIDGLAPRLAEVVTIGGSRAQRDLAVNTVLAALGRADRWDEADELLASVPDRASIHPVDHRARPASGSRLR